MRTIAKINLSALSHNVDCIKKHAPHSKILAMIKSNAYGHGLIPIAQYLKQVDALGIACLKEAESLRQHQIKTPIVLMSGFQTPDEMNAINTHQLDLVIHEDWQIDALKNFKPDYLPKIWLKINTGMNRLGFSPKHVETTYEKLSSLPWVTDDIHLMTHMACADTYSHPLNQKQLNCFAETTKGLSGERSAANSAAIFNFPESHFDWVRPGISLFGISPFEDQSAQSLGLKSVMTVQAKLIAIQYLKKGDFVGYSATWQAPEDMLIGIISMGYGDGYPRHINEKTPVKLGVTQSHLLGRISMDMLAVDLRPAPKAKIGDMVTLWGENCPVESVAKTAETIPYELVCNISQRVDFKYVET